MTTCGRLLPTSSSHSSSVITGFISLATAPIYHRPISPVQGMTGHRSRHQQGRVVASPRTTTTDARKKETWPRRRPLSRVGDNFHMIRSYKRGLPHSPAFAMRMMQSGESRLWRLVISLLFVAGHRHVAGQRARMSRAFSLKVSAPLSTTRDYHARLTSGSPPRSNGGEMKSIYPALTALTATMALAACSDATPKPSPQQAKPSAADLAKADADLGVVPSKVEPTKPLTAVKTASVCKAAIAELFGHSPRIMKTAPFGGVTRVLYRRPDDGKLWTNDCRLDGNRIMWRSVDVIPGRWRDHPADEVLTFKVKGKTVELLTTYSDGSTATAKQPLL